MRDAVGNLQPTNRPRASRASRPSSGRRPNPRAPREHGFWVMLVLVVVGALLTAPSTRTAFACGVFAMLATAGAISLGRRIRKNPALQTVSSGLLAVSVTPLCLWGGASVSRSVVMGAVLTVAFLAGAFLVRSVLERARKKTQSSARAAAAGVLLPAGAVAVFIGAGHLAAAGAVGITLAYSMIVVVSTPSAKRLKLLGLTISLAHFASTVVAASSPLLEGTQ